MLVMFVLPNIPVNVLIICKFNSFAILKFNMHHAVIYFRKLSRVWELFLLETVVNNYFSCVFMLAVSNLYVYFVWCSFSIP